MPHKKNLDALEIIRANYHKTLSYEFEIKTTVSNLISGYNRDLQLTKEPTIAGFSIAKDSLKIMGLIVDNLDVDEAKCTKAMTPELYSAKKVHDLVSKGMSFRGAYKNVSKQF